MQTAFKEWAVVVDALIQGRQIVILRKGGIREGKAGFRMKANRFWLFPTQFHQQRESVVKSAWQRFQADQSAFGCEKEVPIYAMAEIAQSWELADWSQIARLNGQHIWRESVVKERFERGRKKALFAWIVRVYRLGSSGFDSRDCQIRRMPFLDTSRTADALRRRADSGIIRCGFCSASRPLSPNSL